MKRNLLSLIALVGTAASTDSVSTTTTQTLGSSGITLELFSKKRAADAPTFSEYINFKLTMADFDYTSVTIGEGIWLALAFGGSTMGTASDGVICSFERTATITDDSMTCTDMGLTG